MSPHRSHPCKRTGFTLVELLAVMTIIGILAALVLGTFKYVQDKAARSRAEGEIKAMEAALEGYKADNGIYPDNSDTQALNAAVAAADNPTAATYAKTSLILYRALSGDYNLDRKVDAATDGLLDAYGANLSPPPATPTAPKTYFEFKPNQLLPGGGSTAAVTAIADPWGYSYGYSTANQADSTKGYNPTFDLWSTAGGTALKGGESEADYRLRWVKNW